MAYRSKLTARVPALDPRETKTAGHSQRLVRLALALAARLGVPQDEAEHQ